MTIIKRACVSAGIIMSLCLPLQASAASEYPAQAVKLVVPFPPGGGTDSLGRIVAQSLSTEFGQSFVVENKPGAAGVIGANQVSRSKPDGYTLLMAATGAIIPAPGTDAKDYKLVDNFSAVALVAAPPYILAVNNDVPANSVAELVALAKSTSANLTYASSGVGAASHIAGLQLEEKAGIKLLHIPYKGMGQAVTDLMSGQVSLMFAPAPAVLSHIQSGKLKALAVTSAKRSELFPDYPTVSEAGVPGYESVGWFGLFAPPGTPMDVVNKLNKSVNALLQTSEVKTQLKNMGATPANTTPAEFSAFVDEDVKQLVGLLKKATP